MTAAFVFLGLIQAQGQGQDPLSAARAALEQKRDRAAEHRSSENPSGWMKLTSRPVSPFQREKMDEEVAAQPARGESPYNPKFGAPTFEMPRSPGQDTQAPQLTQFVPTSQPGEEGQGGRKFMDRDPRLERPESPRREGDEGRKVTLSYAGEVPNQGGMRTYDEIYQSKSPHPLPTFEMPSGPAAALAGAGEQVWGGRVITQYQPEMKMHGLDLAREERDLRLDERAVKRSEESTGLREMFNRTKRLENR